MPGADKSPARSSELSLPCLAAARCLARSYAAGVPPEAKARRREPVRVDGRCQLLRGRLFRTRRRNAGRHKKLGRSEQRLETTGGHRPLLETAVKTTVGFCPKCAAAVYSDHGSVCTKCFYELPAESELPDTPGTPYSDLRVTTTLEARYLDAYRVAGAINGIGTAIKAISIVLALIVGVGSLASLTSSDGFSGGASGVSGLVAAVVIGLSGFVLGVLVSAQGQILLATLDNTVCNSPFLTTPEKADILKIPQPTAQTA
jgi:hypothetical protein